jgi:hypothetical protein
LPIDHFLDIKEEYHASYQPSKYEIHLSINKGCKSVEIYFRTGDLDPTEP